MQRHLFRNLWVPAELDRFLIQANVVMFVTSLLIMPGGIQFSTNPMQFLAPATAVLVKLGASGTLPVLSDDRWWTLITANYLHGSALHLLFNLTALYSLGRITLAIFGPSRFFLIYFLGGAGSMAVSSFAGIPLTLGASGAICALIGCMAYDDWRLSKRNFKAWLMSVGVWVAFIAITGLALPNVNNWAHASGFLLGFLLGYAFWPNKTRGEITRFRIAASAAMLMTISTLIYGLLFS